MSFFQRILTALGLRKKEKIRIATVKNYDKGECERALAEAEKRLGMKYAGKGIIVIAQKGESMGGGFWGIRKTNTAAGISGNGRKQTIYLYTDPKGAERWNELLHEMAHAVLFSHGQQGHPPQYRKLFENWYD